MCEPSSPAALVSTSASPGLAPPAVSSRSRPGYCFGMPVDCHDTNSSPDGRFAQIAV